MNSISLANINWPVSPPKTVLETSTVILSLNSTVVGVNTNAANKTGVYGSPTNQVGLIKLPVKE